MEPTPSDQPDVDQVEQTRSEPVCETARPWERVQPSATESRQTRETFRPRAPSPGDEILALHDEELQDEQLQDTAAEGTNTPRADTVVCF